MERKVYHYTSIDNAALILGKRLEHNGEEGLIPGRSIGRNRTPGQAAFQRASFGLLEPTPDNWVHNSEYPETWRDLVHDLSMSNHGTILLEVTVDPLKDNVFVADRGIIEDVLYSSKANNEIAIRAGEDRYMESAVPLDTYEKQQRAGTPYALPEVLIMQDLPKEQISVSHMQPLLERDLANMFRIDKRNVVRRIEDGYLAEELSTWKKTFKGI